MFDWSEEAKDRVRQMQRMGLVGPGRPSGLAYGAPVLEVDALPPDGVGSAEAGPAGTLGPASP